MTRKSLQSILHYKGYYRASGLEFLLIPSEKSTPTQKNPQYLKKYAYDLK